MKRFKLTFVLTVLMSMVGLQAFADWDTSTKIEVDGLYYYLDNDNNQAQVTFMPSGKYTGDITVPSSFTYNTINYSVTSIGDGAFNYCSGLTSVTIPNSVKSIGSYAFYDCTGLTSVTIPKSVTSIGDYAFRGCSGLKKVIVKDIAAWCGIKFSYDSNPLYYAHHIYSDENTEITNLIIPNSVTSIEPGAFNYCTGLTSVTIPNSVTSIGDYAFRGCSGLTSVTIPNCVTSIGSSAFNNCSSLISINVESGNTKYDSRNNCNAIIETASNELVFGCKNTTIPNSVTSIGNSAFQDCSVLTSITIPISVTSIGKAAFAGSGLTFIEIPNSVTSIGSSAFWYCTSLSSIIIPNGVASIGDEAFGGCSGLTSITIPNSVTSIGAGVFNNCSGLTSMTVESGNATYDSRDNCNAIIETANNTLIAGCKNTIIPNTVTSIGNGAFMLCSGLTSVTIPNSVTSIGFSAFFGCPDLTSVTFGSAVTSIGGYAFENCSKLTSVTIPNSVTSIGDEAFYSCYGLTSVTIGNSVTSIGDGAFYNCYSLVSVTALNPTPVAITGYVFSNQRNITLYVPVGCKAAYEAANYWKEFKEIIEIDPSGIEETSIKENGNGMINQEEAVWYTIDGKRTSDPQRGLSILRMSNGKTRKVVIK